MTLVLIPCGPTAWRRAGRLLGRAELPLAPDAEAVLAGYAAQVRPLRLVRLLHAPDELCTLTARSLARSLRIVARAMPALTEVDMGLWTGLTAEQLAQRFPTASGELAEAPLNVVAPDGESIGAAAERVRAGIVRVTQRDGRGSVGLVMRPLAMALARAALEGGGYERVWGRMEEPDSVVVVEYRPPRRRASEPAGSGAESGGEPPPSEAGRRDEHG